MPPFGNPNSLAGRAKPVATLSLRSTYFAACVYPPFRMICTSSVLSLSNGYALPFSYTELSCRTLPEPLHRLRYPPRTSQRNVHLYLLLTFPCSHRSYLISSLSLTFILCFVTPPDSVLHMLLIPHPFPSETLPFVPSNTIQTLANPFPHSIFHLPRLRLLSTS